VQESKKFWNQKDFQLLIFVDSAIRVKDLKSRGNLSFFSRG